MQNAASSRALALKFLPLLAAFIAVSGFLFSLGFGLLMLVQKGNPLVMIVWLAAAWAVMLFTRANVRCRNTLKRIYATGSAPDRFQRSAASLDVEDVVFKELPNPAMAFGNTAS